MTNFFLMTCAALANARSVASLSPKKVSTVMLLGTSSHIVGAPGCRASSECSTNGSTSYCTSTASAASIACALVSATTMTTASPTCRTLSTGNSACGPANTGVPPGPVSFWSNLVFGTGSCGMGPILSAAQSAPVKYADHARHRFRPLRIN
jgi:hypothetical protein